MTLLAVLFGGLNDKIFGGLLRIIIAEQRLFLLALLLQDLERQRVCQIVEQLKLVLCHGLKSFFLFFKIGVNFLAFLTVRAISETIVRDLLQVYHI